MDYNYTLLNMDKQINYPSHTKLIDALKGLRQKEIAVFGNINSSLDEFIENIAKNKEVSSFEVHKYINRGASAMVFETPDGDILKLTSGNHFPMNRPHESFDVPIFKKGKCGKIFYYIEEKLFQHELSEGFVEIMKDMIKSEGYKISDLLSSDMHQIGFSKTGKLYLIDPECAKYKTIFHALFDKCKRLMFKKLR